ncbi:hypothetical protein SAMN05443634_10493 [Chishuiella changwenlii]|uniref:Uncharacterized protein n=1 Tax=Chishuiella changwenlii TaxID=1434701 RepID=A0A1M6VYV0_9FLAO|nr:hypothetical protein [Chishuiella changwenlii]GGE89526.1 hypothetical protein GCM10010984_03980 [Chishuiella changwenlii]SHK86627.1 hypothetical protein SAMN05443634_10493 [Chishuiella changwenlii]
MKLFYTFLSFLLLFNCATKHKIKEIEKINANTEYIINKDSISTNYSFSTKIEEIKNFDEFSSLLKSLNISYNGELNDSLKVSFSNKKEGIDLKIGGKGKINYNEQSNSSSLVNNKNIVKTLDSIKVDQSSQSNQGSLKVATNTFRKNTEKYKVDFSIWIYIFAFFIVCVLIILNHFKRKYLK